MPQNAQKIDSTLIGNEAAIDGKNPKFQILKPLRQPRDIIAYRKIGPGVVDPVANANAQLSFLEADYVTWLRQDCGKLHSAWTDLRDAPKDVDLFVRFHKSVHTIAGNAAILNCPSASRLAAPLARLLERRLEVEKHLPLIQSAVDAIDTSIMLAVTEDDPRMTETIEGLETIVMRWITRQH